MAYRDRGNFQVTGAIRAQTLSRPWVTRQAVATRIAWAAGRADAMPAVTGTVRVLKPRAAGLAPGSLFKLSFTQNGVVDLVARVESITHASPGKPEVTVTFREDRGFLNAALALPPDDPAPEDVRFTTAPLSHQTIVELPYGVAGDKDVRLAALAARGDRLSTGMNLWFQKSSGNYANFSTVDGFALRGQVVADYPAGTRIIDEQVKLEIQLDSADQIVDDELALDDALDNALLVFAGTEILSAFEPELIGACRYRLSVVRERAYSDQIGH